MSVVCAVEEFRIVYFRVPDYMWTGRWQFYVVDEFEFADDFTLVNNCGPGQWHFTDHKCCNSNLVVRVEISRESCRIYEKSDKMFGS